MTMPMSVLLSNLPAGFRFSPTDKELVAHYLQPRAAGHPCPVPISDVDIYKHDPWDLPAMATFGDREWYFFTPRDRKYPNGLRPNRTAASGFWKATGTDKLISPNDGDGSTVDLPPVAVKKALVFYAGRPPAGTKTPWIMHEYRLLDHAVAATSSSMRLDEWVLCRISTKTVPPSPAGIQSLEDLLAPAANHTNIIQSVRLDLDLDYYHTNGVLFAIQEELAAAGNQLDAIFQYCQCQQLQNYRNTGGGEGEQPVSEITAEGAISEADTLDTTAGTDHQEADINGGIDSILMDQDFFADHK